LPSRWRDSLDQVTVDDMEAYALKQEDASPEATKPIREVLDELNQKAAYIPRQRTLRKLEIPEKVELYYQGTTRGSAIDNMQTLEQQDDKRFSKGSLPELKENIRLWARGADYSTPKKTITVVPPPELSSLSRNEYQPAYLYYRLASGAEGGADPET